MQKFLLVVILLLLIVVVVIIIDKTHQGPASTGQPTSTQSRVTGKKWNGSAINQNFVTFLCAEGARFSLAVVNHDSIDFRLGFSLKKDEIQKSHG